MLFVVKWRILLSQNVGPFGVTTINYSTAATGFIGKQGFMDGSIRLSVRICSMAPWINPTMFTFFFSALVILSVGKVELQSEGQSA